MTTAYPVSARLLVQGVDPGPLPVLPDGLEGEHGGQQAFDPGLTHRSSMPSLTELEQEAQSSPADALVGGVHPLGRLSSHLPGGHPGSPQPQEGQQVLEQPSQHDEQGGEEKNHQTQPAQLPVFHHRLPEPLIPPGPDGCCQESGCRSAPFSL